MKNMVVSALIFTGLYVALAVVLKLTVGMSLTGEFAWGVAAGVLLGNVFTMVAGWVRAR